MTIYYVPGPTLDEDMQKMWPPALRGPLISTLTPGTAVPQRSMEHTLQGVHTGALLTLGCSHLSPHQPHGLSAGQYVCPLAAFISNERNTSQHAFNSHKVPGSTSER